MQEQGGVGEAGGLGEGKGRGRKWRKTLYSLYHVLGNSECSPYINSLHMTTLQGKSCYYFHF